MKILEASEVTSWIIETDETCWPTFRRNGPNNWEQLMGESWEGVYFEEAKLEGLFQDFLRKHTL